MPSDDISRVVPAFAPNTSIKSSEMNPELNQLVSTMNSKASRTANQTISGNNAFTGNNSHAGVETFSNLQADAISEITADAGVSVDSVLLKDGSVRLTGSAGFTPAANGDFGYDTTNNQYLGMANGTIVNFTSGVSAVVPLTGNATLGVGDKGKIYDALNILTLTTIDPTLLPDPWWFYVQNSGTGAVAIDPFGASTIDGLTSLNAYPGEGFTVYKSGSNLKTMGRQRGWILLGSALAASATTVDFTNFINSDFNQYVLLGQYVRPATDGAVPTIRFSADGGTSYLAGTSYKYRYVTHGLNTGSSTGASGLVINDGVGNADGEGCDFELSFSFPSSTQAIKTAQWQTNGRDTSSGIDSCIGWGLASNATAINGVRFLFSTGAVAEGRFELYGVRQ